jgi:hypothetical protein
MKCNHTDFDYITFLLPIALQVTHVIILTLTFTYHVPITYRPD